MPANASLQRDWNARLGNIRSGLGELENDSAAAKADARNDYAGFLHLLKDACTLVRDAEHQGASEAEFYGLVEEVEGLLNGATNWVYSVDGGPDFLPSFAHDDGTPIVKEGAAENEVSGAMAGMLQRFMAEVIMKNIAEPARRQAALANMPSRPAPWAPSMKPHPKSTRVARACTDLPSLSTSVTTPLANIVYQARCDVSSDDICVPVTMTMAADNGFLAVASMGGWKNREPVLSYSLLGDSSSSSDGDGGSTLDLQTIEECGFEGIAHALSVDHSRSLLFAADEWRIKSYNYQEGCLPVHTLRSEGYSGALTVLSGSGGRAVRAGQGRAAVWALDSLPTHGSKGKKIIGGKLSRENMDSWRDEDAEIELSKGSAPTGVVAFEDKTFAPVVWAEHPNAAGVMIGGSNPRAKSTDCDYRCLAVDLDHGGKTTTRYLGHGGQVVNVHTSAEDKNTFVTACSDGFARLYDVRHPLPVLTVDVGGQESGCGDAILIHPDGIPTIFCGGAHKQHITMVDVRARATVYTLGTGNNDVIALSWDSKRSTLYAATECEYQDRMGGHFDYRRATIPKRYRFSGTGEEEEGDTDNGKGKGKAGAQVEDEAGVNEDWEDDEDEEEDDDDEEDWDDEEGEYDDEGPCWPERAYQSEDYYGYAFDSGTARLYKYAFKENPGEKCLPSYGFARMTNGLDYW